MNSGVGCVGGDIGSGLLRERGAGQGGPLAQRWGSAPPLRGIPSDGFWFLFEGGGEAVCLVRGWGEGVGRRPH